MINTISLILTGIGIIALAFSFGYILIWLIHIINGGIRHHVLGLISAILTIIFLTVISVYLSSVFSKYIENVHDKDVLPILAAFVSYLIIQIYYGYDELFNNTNANDRNTKKIELKEKGKLHKYIAQMTTTAFTVAIGLWQLLDWDDMEKHGGSLIWLGGLCDIIGVLTLIFVIVVKLKKSCLYQEKQ